MLLLGWYLNMHISDTNSGLGFAAPRPGTHTRDGATSLLILLNSNGSFKGCWLLVNYQQELCDTGTDKLQMAWI
jgi:hypothetical protein